MQVSASEPDPAIVLSLHIETRFQSQSRAWKANKPICQVEAQPSHPAAEKPRSLAAVPRKQITAVSGGRLADGLILCLAKARAGWKSSHPLGFISQASHGQPAPCLGLQGPAAALGQAAPLQLRPAVFIICDL